MCTGRFGGLSEMAQQRRRQHILDQGGLARAGNTGHHHQTLQRKLDADVPQVVLTRAFQNQAWRAVGHHALEAHAHLLARTQVGTGQGVGTSDCLGCAVEHDLAPALAGAGAHVDQAVGRQHHGRVVLDHHQGVAGVPQAQHGVVDAGHVARVQADAGLIEHEQGVDQRGAQRGRQVDALDFTAAEGATLPVQREVANANFAEVTQSGVDFLEQQLEGLLLARTFAASVGDRSRRNTR